MEYHDAANIFPMMGDEEYQALVADIRTNGLHEPIWLHDGKIIDGRNRYRACQELDIEPTYRTWDGTESLVAFVVSLNLKRRHLTSSQKAVVALEIEKQLAVEAKERQRGGQGGVLLSQKFEQANTGKSSEQAAAIVGTNRQYVSDAKRIEKVAPDLLDDIRSGTLTIESAKTLALMSVPDRNIALDKIARGEAKDAKDAKRQLNRQAKIQMLVQQSRPLDGTLGSFPIIYADPPWRYDENTTDPTRQIENQYPTMSLDEHCALDVPAITTPDCILFLWATSPLLEQAIQLLNAWGFAYQTNMVWVKPSIGPGYWFRQQHELLLVATKGNPPKAKPRDRVSSVFHAPRLEHSAKPHGLYDLIEHMYPELPKIELFARNSRDGWVQWGAEAPV